MFLFQYILFSLQPSYSGGVHMLPDPPEPFNIGQADLHNDLQTSVEVGIDVSWEPALDPYLGSAVLMSYQWTVVARHGNGEADEQLFQWTHIPDDNITKTTATDMVVTVLSFIQISI